MSEFEQDPIEAELRRAKPARLPERLLNRLNDSQPWQPAKLAQPARPALFNSWRVLVLRWFVPAGAVAALALIAVHFSANHDLAGNSPKPHPSAIPVLLADKVQVNNELSDSFDVVAVLPGGEPIRFRCRQWNDEFIITDNRGLEIEQDQRRLEVIPLKFETY